MDVSSFDRLRWLCLFFRDTFWDDWTRNETNAEEIPKKKGQKLWLQAFWFAAETFCLGDLQSKMGDWVV